MENNNKSVKYNPEFSMITNLVMWLGLQIKFMKFDGEINTIERIVPHEKYPILMSNGESYSYNGFLKNYTNVDGSSLENE